MRLDDALELYLSRETAAYRCFAGSEGRHVQMEALSAWRAAIGDDGDLEIGSRYSITGHPIIVNINEEDR